MTAKTHTQQVHKAKRITLLIAVFGLGIAYALNYNLDLVFRGTKYTGNVRSVSLSSKGARTQVYKHILDIEFEKNNQLVNIQATDYAQSAINKYDKKDIVLYESKTEPYRYYIPKINSTITRFVLLFFVGIPLVFAVLGRRDHL
jgi:hypothetical protein